MALRAPLPSPAPPPDSAQMALRPQALHALFDVLRAAYGPQSWWPAGSELEMILGALLVQHTAWTSARRALDNLRAVGLLDLHALLAVPEPLLADAIRPSGYYHAKARKLQAFARCVAEHDRGDLHAFLARPLGELRPLLLATHGFGPETTDAVLLYAARRPVFVVDAYTRRLLHRLGWIPARAPYESLRAAIEAALPRDLSRYAEDHALIVVHGKRSCRKRPRCDACPLLDRCATGRRAAAGASAAAGDALPSRRRDWNT